MTRDDLRSEFIKLNQLPEDHDAHNDFRYSDFLESKLIGGNGIKVIVIGDGGECSRTAELMHRIESNKDLIIAIDNTDPVKSIGSINNELLEHGSLLQERLMKKDIELIKTSEEESYYSSIKEKKHYQNKHVQKHVSKSNWKKK